MTRADDEHPRGGPPPDADLTPSEDEGLYSPPDRYERDIPVSEPGPEQVPRVRGGDPAGPRRGPSPDPPSGADSTESAP